MSRAPKVRQADPGRLNKPRLELLRQEPAGPQGSRPQVRLHINVNGAAVVLTTSSRPGNAGLAVGRTRRRGGARQAALAARKQKG